MRRVAVFVTLCLIAVGAGVALAAQSKTTPKTPAQTGPMEFDGTADIPKAKMGDAGIIPNAAGIDWGAANDATAPAAQTRVKGLDGRAATVTPQAQGWTEQDRYESVHFSIIADIKDDAYFHRLQNDLEKHFSHLQKEFWDFIPPLYRESHMTVMAFGSQSVFDEFAASDSGLPRGQKGYSRGDTERIVYVRQQVYYRDVMILVHEMTHMFNRFCLGRSPVWLDEGMAQYYSYYAGQESGNGAIRSGVNPDSLRAIDAALKNGTFVEVADLFEMEDGEFYGGPEGETPAINYAESWALVYYLRRGATDGDEQFSAFYEALVHKEDPYDAFVSVYGDNRDLFSQMWIGYLQQLYKSAFAQDKAAPAARKSVQGNDGVKRVR
jgi:hypothetical protein